jgi:hypothetical protein
VAKEKILKRNRGSNDNKANGESLFQKYWTCGSLTDINTDIQDKWAVSCVEIKERSCDSEELSCFMQAPSAP